ncbi:MAG: glycerate kinase [Bryobacteraceae bacterium]
MTANEKRLRRDAGLILKAAFEAAHAGNAVRRHLRKTRNVLQVGHIRYDLRNFDRILFFGVGKASLAMAAAVAEIVGPELQGGLVVTKHGHGGKLPKTLRLIESAHPVPDESGARAASDIIALLRELNTRDLLIVAVSGGASALLPAPVAPITLEEKGKTTDLLLKAGADIFELNAVRKHLSSLKGGQLAALAYPATVVSLQLSDVIGDPMDVIGSGLTAPDTSTFAQAIQVIRRYGLWDRIPPAVRERLEEGKAGRLPETPKPSDPLFDNVQNLVVGSSRLALAAAAKEAKRLGYKPLILSSTMQGETREVARVHAEILREVRNSGSPLSAPACLLTGGETTVTVRGAGKGGRNQEFVLAAAIAISALRDVLVASAGTDGTDGPTDAAGARADGGTLKRAEVLGYDLQDHLDRNDSYPVFEALGDLIKTGPTGTNVMDVHLLLAC